MDRDKIQKFIKQLSYEELQLYVMGFIEEEPQPGRKLYDYISMQLNHVGLDNAEVSVDQTFGRLEKRGTKWNSIYVRDWDQVEHESHKLFERARNAIASGQPDIALIIGTRWLEDFAYYHDENELYYYDEEELGLGQACGKAEEVISKALEHPNVSEDVRKDVAKRLEELCNADSNSFNDYGYLDIVSLANRAKLSCLSDEEALNALTEQLAKNFDTDNVELKYNLLLKMGRVEEADAFIEEFLKDSRIGVFYVKNLFESQRYERIIPVLKTLINTPYDDHYYRPIQDWKETLAESQDLIGLKDDATQTYREIFISNPSKISYHNLKKRISTEKWAEYLEETIQKAEQSGHSIKGSGTYAGILLEEERINELHDWLKNRKSTSAFAEYTHHIPQEQRGDLLPIYRDLILEQASHATDKYDYNYVCDDIEKLLELPEGEPFAKEIATEIKTKYWRRRNFTALLKEVMGNIKY